MVKVQDMSEETKSRLFHPEDVCQGEYCCIHNPSDHQMVDWPLILRGDRIPLMERICPHGIGHPDPDCLDYLRRVDPPKDDQDFWHWEIHGCDWCCNGS